jgi:hypothetical protein
VIKTDTSTGVMKFKIEIFPQKFINSFQFLNELTIQLFNFETKIFNIVGKRIFCKIIHFKALTKLAFVVTISRDLSERISQE